MRIHLLVFFIIISHLFNANEHISACTCVPRNPPEIEYAISDAVFSGTVVEIKIDTVGYPLYYLFQVTFSIIQSYKGINSPSIVITTPVSDLVCGYSFILDTTYLVYSYFSSGSLWTNICTRTKKLSEAAEDLQYLNTLGVNEKESVSGYFPNTFRLYQNYPNPFNPTTTIEFSIPKSEFVTLKVYNILGEEVAMLVSERLSAGKYKYDWDAGDLTSGVYLYRIQAGDYVESKKMVLLR
jgi:hypothetical protein